MSTEQPWTIGRLLDWTTKYLEQKGSESPRLDTEVLLAHALGCKRIDLYTRHDEEALEPYRQKFRELIRQRMEGCPVAYLVGRKEFFSLEFEVNRAVLIPRPDTECVVDECLRLAKGVQKPRVLDIGTGSGCLAVAVAKHHKKAQVTAVDISPEALSMASSNAGKHGLAERIRFLQGDLFRSVPSGERFDFILSNPPYIPHDDLDKLPAGVRDYEPRLALDGGADGFAVFDRLIADAPGYLEKGGYLILEIGSPQEAPARERIGRYADYELAKTIHDGSGHPRVLRARRRPGT
jgi:release factor glutamine methyltransferase